MICLYCHECEHWQNGECDAGILRPNSNGRCPLFSQRRAEFRKEEDVPGQAMMFKEGV